ncbi:hypothetical protein BJV82DRAFT_636789 [Fennellomyces sp. T-0311]|nr:hypothetical protein BJV82DRAFT_636789 [Fennellomyces sp. T-0311]
MFSPPSKTLQSALNKLLDCAQEYLADVCFDYPCGKIWAHRAIILARAPKAFSTQHLPELVSNANSMDLLVIKDPIVPYTTLQQLLRFWYTAEFSEPDSSEVSSLSTLSLTSTQTSASSATLSTLRSSNTDFQPDIIKDIQHQEKRLGTSLLPPASDAPLEQLKDNIAALFETRIANDVVLNLYTSPKDGQKQQQCTIPIHRCILAAQSPHFYAMFCTEFREASSSTIYLPSDIFSPTSFDVILRYYYTDTLRIPPGPPNDTSPVATTKAHQQSLPRKKYSLRLLHDVFRLADYLNDKDTVCQAVLYEMAELCNQFKCSCSDCAALLPSMLWFSDQYKSHVPELRQNLISIYAEPVHSLASLWSAQAFSILADSKTTNIVAEIVSQITANIKKQTAIQVLEALHLCLSRMHPTNASTVTQILDNLASHTVSIISDNFEFYCVEYPILLSCVDGIAVGSGLSVDFLEFLMTRVMHEGINENNAGELYQSIVRDLIGRQEMDQDRIVDNVLVDAYQQCVAYLAHNWSQVKALGGFKKLEKDIMRKLSEDIEVPYRSLTKSFETDFASLFGFRSRSSNKSRKAESEYGGRRGSAASSSLSYRRLSLLSLRSRRSHDSLSNKSTSSAATHHISNTLTQQRDPAASNLLAPNSLANAYRASNPSLRELVRDDSNLENPNNSVSPSLLADALLPMDSSGASMSKSSSTPVRSSTPTGRQTRLRFELPTMPQRPASTAPTTAPAMKILLQPRNKKNKQKKIKRSHSPLRARLGWGSSSSDMSDDDDCTSTVMPVLGAKVELLRRPLPMQGTIKYIGEVHFAKGVYVGIELENRLGSNDGSYDGTRYFHTDQQRGAFCKVDDFKIISMPVTAAHA